MRAPVTSPQTPSAPARHTPVGTVHVVDPSPLNWLFLTWNTMEEPVRTDQQGRIVNALAESAEWVDHRTLELRLRRGVRFQDGEAFTAYNVKQNFDEMQKWAAPHPPGTWLNLPPESRAEVVDGSTVRFHLPGPDGLAIGKFRGCHLASSEFWDGPDAPGFGYKKLGSGEGHW